MKTSQKGFTLVEIAIVLVIIGLLLGGILKGQEMINQAKIKNVIADITGVSAAMYGYQDRYRALPGDDKGADRWSGVSPGNGNGVILGKYATTTDTDESRLFWEHLRRAGFVGGSGLEQPFNAVSGKTGVQTGDGTSASPNPGVLGKGSPVAETFTGLILCTAMLPDKIAISIDAQMDDGNGTTGAVRGKKGPGNLDIPSGGAAEEYKEDGVSTYVVCRQM
jgi:prepilin-type N-terminal cleavage/methylation domain-containing protein